MTSQGRINKMIALVSLLLFTIIFSIILISRRKFNYWTKRNVSHAKPSLFVGNYGPYILQKEYLSTVSQKICQKFPDLPYIGAFYGTEPALIVQDSEMIKNIMAKDFYYFNSREISQHTHKEFITRNLFFGYGDSWKIMRQNLLPFFSSGNMKNMFKLIQKCCNEFETVLEKSTAESNVVVVNPVTDNFTINCVCSCVFGIDLTDSETNPFAKLGRVIFDVSSLHGFKIIARAIWPSIFYGLGLTLYPKWVYNFFINLLRNVFESREGLPCTRHDFIDLLSTLREKKHISGNSIKGLVSKEKVEVILDVDDELLAAECVVLFSAGYETSATLMAFTLYELAKDQAAQNRVLAEVDAYMLSRDKVHYDCVSELPFLGQCMDEALRLYPALGVITREVYEAYTLPSGLRLEPGLRVHIPVYHIHRDPRNFPDPDSFRPERFSPDEKKNIKPYTYLPFGEGFRICMGIRFARMQVIAGLVTIFKKYKIELAEGMAPSVKFEPRSIVTQCAEPIRLKFVNRAG